MRRALSLLRPQPVYRRDRFAAGLQAAGFRLCQAISDPQPGDIILSWNRYGHWDADCRRFERGGATVLIAENGYLPIPKWHALAVGHHAGAGTWVDGGSERWDALGLNLAPWRTSGETLIIGQRSIGEEGIASPRGWEEETRKRIGGRIRPHPGKHPPVVSLADDLNNAGAVVTWASSAALTALMLGIPVFYGMPKWIGAGAGLPLSSWGQEPKRDDAARLAMFRRLVWAQWRVEEIEDGTALRHLLKI